MKFEVEWFYYLAFRAGLLAPDAIAGLREQMGAEAGLATLSQAIITSAPGTDLVRLQALLSEASRRAQTGTPPALPLPAPPPPPPAGEPRPEPAPAAPSAGPCLDAYLTLLADGGEFDAMDDAAMSEWVFGLLAVARARASSDLHLSATAPPLMRRFGVLEAFGNAVLSPAAARRANTLLLSEQQQELFNTSNDLTYALAAPTGERYRVNIVVHRDGVCGTYHMVPTEIPEIAELGFSNEGVIRQMLAAPDGLILVAGPAGSGKTTTLATLVDSINRSRYDHVVIIEEPLEVVHSCHRCLVTQREVGLHTETYASALRAALREDPDVIVIGELHDRETMGMAMTAAQTGHLVLGTLHTHDAATTLHRLLDAFPPAQRQQIRAMTSESLLGIICQRLLPDARGEGRVVASEVLVRNPAVAKLIREGRLHQLRAVMQTGVREGMRTMDQCLIHLVQEGRISESTAMAHMQSREMAHRVRRAAPQAVSLPPVTPGTRDGRTSHGVD